MTAYDPSLGRSPDGLLGWLGFGRRPAAITPPELAVPPLADRRDELRLRQLGDVGQFLRTHQLEVTAATLSTAWLYLSGTDSQVIRAVDRRVLSRQPVTTEWLDTALGEQPGVDEAALWADLMARLEINIAELASNSSAAHSATKTYHNALEGHVGELEHAAKTGAAITELASIAKTMLLRTREIEKQMLRSEAQTRALKRRLDEARRSAAEDHLTGLPNRRAFEAVLGEQHLLAQAAGEFLCVAFCDIDHFKRVNDEHGHDAGDRVLKLVADGLAKVSNDRCHVARHGGEEFVMLFRGEQPAEVMVKLDRLRSQLADRRLVNRASEQPFGQITFSAGLAEVFAFGDPRSALKAADVALYRAKQEGRNRIVMADPVDPPLSPGQLEADPQLAGREPLPPQEQLSAATPG